MLRAGDILGNLMVPLEKFLKFYFGMKHRKNDHSREWSEVTSALVLKSMCPFTSQKCSLFPKLPFYFPKSPFCFPKVRFCFLELLFCFPEVSLYFSKMAHCFPELPLVFQKYLPNYFPRMLFFQLTTFSSYSELLREYLPCTFVPSWNSLLTNS